MKEKIRIVLLTTIIFLFVYSLFQYFSPDKLITKLFSRTGTLKVESLPKTSIFLDGKLIGQSPLETNIPSGSYDLKLVAQDKSTSLLSFNEKITVVTNALTYVNRELTDSLLTTAGEILTMQKVNVKAGQILVNSDPNSIFVILDGQERGITPLLMDNVNPGEHELTFTSEGMKTRSIKINIVSGYQLQTQVKLAIDKEYQARLEAKKKTLVTPTKKNEKAKYLEIGNTDTGWLRVRLEPNLGASESAKVDTGKKFPYYSEQDNWYEIEYEKGKRGWVSGDYVNLLDE